MRWRSIAGLAGACLLSAALGLQGCATATSPATGRTFTTPISESEEAGIGREEHPKILAEFGGAYAEIPALNAYVSGVGGKLAAVGERPDVKYRFTVLNTPDVNAFALPGGYVYITRGLLALADNEAELAGVLGHEIGHVTARHTAERIGQQQQATILGTLGVLAGGILFGQSGAEAAGILAQEGISTYIGQYSQEQEFEADSLGVRYMRRVDYRTDAMASFLDSLRAQDQLELSLSGEDPSLADRASMKASHPRTLDRVQRAIAEAGPSTSQAILARDRYLNEIDGMVFGDDPSAGLVRGREFLHPGLRFRFQVPKGYRILNHPDMVVIKGPKGTMQRLKLAKPQYAGDLGEAIAALGAREGVQFGRIERLRINGLESATGLGRVNSRSGLLDLRVVLIRHPAGKVYEFDFLSDARLNGQRDQDAQSIAFSFQPMNAQEAAAIKPLRIRIVAVQPGDTLASLSKRMKVAAGKEGWFRVLNAIKADRLLKIGERVKIVGY
jgi:predicted Zn-dependent protease